MSLQTERQLDQLFEPWQRELCPGVQVLIRKNGQNLYEKSFGYANLEHRIPIDSDTRFHVASISKQFTVLAALLLWKEGKLDLDGDIRNYVGDLISFEEPVTVRQLMNNVSGLRDQWELLFMRGIKINDDISMEDINTSLKLQKKLNFPPQSQYLYSNMGFHLLAVMVERLSGLTFPEFAKKRIFRPLGMERTLVRSSFTQIIPNLAYSYQDEGNGSYYYNPLNYSLYGPTAVNTCARDLSRMLREYIEPRIIDPEIIRIMKTPAVLSDGSQAEYCGGLMTCKLHGLTVYEHGGADAAYRGHVLCIPEEGLEVIILSNTTSRLMSKMAKKAASLALGLSDSTEPQVDAEGATGPQAGRYLTSRPDDPLFVEIVSREDGFYMKREYGETKLTKTSRGGWQVGTLDEEIFFKEGEILYRLPGRALLLKEARPVKAGSGRERCAGAGKGLAEEGGLEAAGLAAGTHFEPETTMEFQLEETEAGWKISMPRYGEAKIYCNQDGDAAFSFNPDFTMYLRAEADGIWLDGYRVRGMKAKRRG